NNRNFFLIEVASRISGVSFQDEYYAFKNNFSNEMKIIRPVKIFISYNHLVFKLADTIEKELNNLYGPKIEISRDTQLQYKQDIDEFMKSIKNNDLIIALVSNTYLKSEACMFEISELMRDSKYVQRLAYIILSKEDENFFDNEMIIGDLVPEIYTEKRFDYLIHWTDVRNEYTGKMDKLRDNYSATVELNERIRRTAIISQEVGPFIELLNRLNGQDFSTMYNNKFIEITKLIDNSFEEKNSD
ncbi:MAG: TIR domain-containing protein, partial [Carnobacterium sp.]